MIEGIVFWFAITAMVACACGTRVTLAKIKARERSGYSEDDTRMSQEIHRSLQKMEKRIEALETLLIDNEKRARADELAAQIERL